MAHYPLMFTFRDAISGNGFLAGVTLSGRALALKEDDEKWWVYGVRPAAIAECGETPQEAFANFRNRYKAVLFDYASDTFTYDAFKKAVEAFYSAPDREEEARWESAFTAIRNGDTIVEPPFTDLPKEPPESRPSSISVVDLHLEQRHAATDNVPDIFVLSNAA